MASKDTEQALSRSEQTLLRTITSPDTEVGVIIPDTIDSKEYFSTLSAVCRATHQAALATEKLMPLLGRLLVVAKEHPDLYTDAGYATFDELVAKIGVEYGVGRSTCYEAKALVERWGQQIDTVGTFQAVGRVKFQILSKVVPKGDEGKANVTKLIEAAKEMTIEQLKDHLEEKYGRSRSELVRGGVIKIECGSKKREKMINDFFTNENVIAYCESDRWDFILERAIEECLGTWLASVEEAKGTAE